MKQLLRILGFVLFASGALAASVQPSGDGRAASATPQADTPIELGLVKWERNFETAKKTAKTADKPILLLFQEVPG